MEAFLQQLMTLLCGNQPQGLVFGALILLVVQRLGITLPNLKLPVLPVVPKPSAPSLPILVPNPDGSPRAPNLRKLLEIILGGMSLADVPAPHLAAASEELAALRAEKAEKHRAELAALEK